MKASKKDRWVTIQTGKGDTEILVKEGEFIFGRLVSAEELDMKPSSVRNRIKKLKKLRNVDIQVDTHYSIISICNWQDYQGNKNKSGQASGQAEDSQRTGKGQAKDTDKNVKNVKNEKKKDNIFVTPSQFVQWWNKEIAELLELKKCLRLKSEDDPTLFIHIGTRLRKHPEIEYWERVKAKIASSPYLLGQLKGKQWKITIDFLVKNEGNHLKILEGTYESKQGIKYFTGD